MRIEIEGNGTMEVETDRPGLIKNRVVNRIYTLKTKLDDASEELMKRVNTLNSNVMEIRKDPEVIKIWNSLCQLHRLAIALCTSMGDTIPDICALVLQPQGCVERLHLSDEETCCNRFLEKRGISI